MYQCSLCGKVVPPKTARQTIIQYKEVTHPYREKAGKKLEFKYGKWRWEWYPDTGGKGKQIEREFHVCPSCKADYEKEKVNQLVRSGV
jgi:hypothetical protein